MNLQQIRDDLLRKIWVEHPADAPAYLLDDVAVAVNQAMQAIWLSEDLHFSRAESRSVIFGAGVNKVTLGADVQRVLGDVRRNDGGFLRPVYRRADIEYYARRFLGQMDESTGVPVVYWVQSVKSSSGGDSVSAVLWVAPIPASTTEVIMQVELDAPHYTAGNLATTGTIAMPHQYVEALFLPLARYFITRSHWFSNEEHRAAFQTDAEAAMVRFGMAVPWRATAKEEGKEAAK